MEVVVVTRHVWIDGTRVALTAAQLVGQGGEAEVYDLGDGRVVKWWKPPQHPDFVGLDHEQANAAKRLVEAPAKLRALPGNLPTAVVAPCGWALGSKRGTPVGFVMPRVNGEPLHSFGEPRWRREHPVVGSDVVAALVALHDAVSGLHRAGVVIGDFNDLNVLVDGRQVHLIDVDSYQFGGFACSMFSERFVDPRLCDGPLVPVRPHDCASDWFAFAAMAFRTLLGVGPWGGVVAGMTAAKRALERRSVMANGVVYPRAARPLATLPDDMLAVFRDVFERDVRGELPRAVLAGLRLAACAACGDEHARSRCPACQTATRVPPSVVHGRMRCSMIAAADVVVATRSVGRRAQDGIWLAGDALMRATSLGPERIGSVVAGQTRAWVGPSFGVGFYRAGGYAVGFVFRRDRGGLDDRVQLPAIRGQLVSAGATIGDDRAWLWLTCTEGGRLVTTCIVIGADASTLAIENVSDAPWLPGLGGACAAGPYLFVPTDDGIVRVEVAGSAIAVTRVFAETATVVGAADRLALSSGGIDVLRRADALRLQLT
jgi:hypothetical protein